jgi:hypothetical protein
LLLAPPDRRSRLGLDLLDQASRDQLRRDLMRRNAFQLIGERQAVIIPLCGSAQHDELRVRKFDGHRNRPFAVMRPSQPRPLTDASPGFRRSPGAKGRPRKVNPPRDAHTHALFGTERQSFLRVRTALSAKLWTFDSHGFRFAGGRFGVLPSSSCSCTPESKLAYAIREGPRYG